MREMKDSGIEWCQKIPANWRTLRIKYIMFERREKTKTGSEEPLSVTQKYGIVKSKDIEVSNPSISYNDYIIVSKDDIVFNKYKAHSGVFFVTPYDGIVTFNYSVYRCYKGYNPKYYEYLFHTHGCIGEFKMRLHGVGESISPLYTKDLFSVTVFAPPIEEQNRIVEYIDKFSFEINTTVSDIELEIETLEEYKRSVITEAVTKGLDPDVEMRDSGVQWIGDIPAHWITHPLYFYFGVRKNKNALGLETNLLSLSYGKIIRKDINSNGGLLPESFNTYNIIEKDDIIIRPTDLQNDKRSLRTGIAREHGIITSAYIAMKAIKSVNLEYFHYLLHAYDVMKVFYNMGNGVRQGLNFSEFSRLMVFEPTIEEQNAIVEYLKEKCDEIDLAIAEKKHQIETIEEYKKSLIFEYVTGKKEVQA